MPNRDQRRSIGVCALCAAIALALTDPAGAAKAQTTSRDILARMEHAADWELAHPAEAANPPSIDADKKLGWMRGAFYTGLAALADRSADPRYADTISTLGAREHWSLEPRPFHADDQEMAQNWIWAYRRNRDPAVIAFARARFDSIIAAAPSGSLLMTDPAGCVQRWCWADALFMAPPGWIAMSDVTGDPRYRAYADREFRATTALLFDPKWSLFYRDSNYLGRAGADGQPIFWSRGNGWVYAGLARILAELPPRDPARAFYRNLYLRMSARILSLQKPDGCWAPSLLDPDTNLSPETSGTGFFTFGIAWGVRSGLLRNTPYRPAAERGWDCLVGALQPDGRLGWVQSQNEAPGAVGADDTQPYGVGAFLLAGAAMYDLARATE